MKPKTEQRVEDGEKPVRICNGMVLANSAFHCKPVDLWPTKLKEAKPEWIPAMEHYLNAFARPVRTIADEIRCLACDEQVTAHHLGLADPRFKHKLEFSEKWPHEGRCTSCGYPCQLGHQIFYGDELLVKLSNFPLFFHPDATGRIS